MIKVGITGGIGSGKTTVSKVFKCLGIPVFNSDEAARNIVNEDTSVIEAIKNNFGEDLYEPGNLNRPKMASIVFGNADKLNQLNSIVHPAVGKAFDQWCASQSDAPFVLKEAAILVETKGYENLNHLILVTAPQSTRIHRVMERDSVSEEQVRERMAKQLSDEEKRKFADFEIVNDGQQLVIPQVLEIYKAIIGSYS